MKLHELIDVFQKPADDSVPDWMIGAFKRRSISFANGLTDTDTNVFWLQSRNLTIDLRLPVQRELVAPKKFEDYSKQELLEMIDYEGWSADSIWSDERLSWQGGPSFQIHNRWPEPAELKRVGDCMIEFAPSGAYVEDWRLLSKTPGPLVGLKLIDETDLSTGEIRHSEGALIINGNLAGLVLGRPAPLDQSGSRAAGSLRNFVDIHSATKESLSEIFQFETFVAEGDVKSGFTIKHSLKPEGVGKRLLDLDGFNFNAEANEIQHTFESGNTTLKRRFCIDSLETHFEYTATTAASEASKQWFTQEQKTLGRYLKALT